MSIADLVRACGKAFYGNEPDYETAAIAYAMRAIAAVAIHQANGFADSRLHGLHGGSAVTAHLTATKAQRVNEGIAALEKLLLDGKID